MKGITCRKTKKLVNASIARQEELRKEQEEIRKSYERLREETEMTKKETEMTKKETEMMKKENERMRKEYEREWNKIKADLGKLGISLGEQVEEMFVNLHTKFNELGFNFPKESGRTLFRENGRALVEVDRLLENGAAIMSVEVKAKFRLDYVNDHIERLGILSEYFKKNNDNRKVMGAIAGGIIPENIMKYAHRKGLYVLVQNGESVSIAALPEGFVPNEW